MQGDGRSVPPHAAGDVPPQVESLSMTTGILSIAVLLLAIAVVALIAELRATHKAQRASTILQLRQQLQSPALQAAIAKVHALESLPHMNGHRSNGHSPKGLVALDEYRIGDESTAVSEIDHFFGHVGQLVRLGVADDEVFAMMGPTISDMWHSTRAARRAVAGTNGDKTHEDFEWLYVEWLNWDYRRRERLDR
jgi:hypothetical protein